MRGRIILISGVSGAGKTTLVNLLLKEKKNLVRAISFTTRKPRTNEVDGKDYFFIEKKHFLKKVENGELLEYSEVYGDLYGTGLDSFKEIENGNDVIKIIDVQGALKLKNAGVKALYIFLKVPKKTVEKRLKERNEENTENRLKEYENELKASKVYDYVITTGGSVKSIEKNVQKLRDIIN